ncbi:AAA family ATPase [Paenibacillus sacheonensis]|uniref:AAA family ATPase n=1 Tax=Paenibacillus sacheonensis TaxID=742054 RepID=A0A7X4YLJ3_9BACL|nr:AAA family ATPase [Paenibacillus sacheonensis]MBM7568298.1 SpoVK/Ycf46/Vps4 family AAA+-type ATPase [Paenibacillus sacheonensis]NBC68517.1 AAA family ATPase [Paenibacillus sacheonensis]
MTDIQRAYKDPSDHLSDELKRLDIRLESEALHMNAAPQSELPFNEFPGLFVNASEAKSFLGDDNNGFAYTYEQAERLQAVEARLEARLQATERQGIRLPLVALRRRFGLGELESRCLIAAVAPHAGRPYDKVYGYLQGDYVSPYLSIDLMLRLCGDDAAERRSIIRLLSEGSSFRDDFFDARDDRAQAPASSLLSRAVRLKDRMVHYLLGMAWKENGPLARVRFYPSSEASLPPILLHEELQKRVNDYVLQRRGRETAAALMIHGPSGSGKTYLARQACAALGQSLLEWDLRDAPEEERPFIEAIDRLLVEAKLSEAIPAFDHLHILQRPRSDRTTEDRRLERLMERLDACKQLLFLFSEEEVKPVIALVHMVAIHIPLGTPDIGERKRLWQSLAKPDMRLSSEAAETLAGKFQFTPGKIAAAIDDVRKSAEWRSPGKGDSSVGQASPLLHRAAYQLISHGLKEKAAKLEPRFGWEDLILPPDTEQLLRQACDRVKYRHQVLHEWGFEGKLPYGKGISMLFTGPPGTGKTMSAMVLAKEMDSELYRVDLSRVVSKYIGETEKNLSDIFDQAKLSGAILFFDEADALFGKRSEVKDSHDKHANMETAYLLQKMEEYDGLTIMATNFAQNLDDAFTRRIPFIIKYPFPDATQREQLWRATFPKKLPVAEIDYAFLSQTLELAGGPIKNIVVTAAFLAAREGVPVSMKQIIGGVVQEYKKTGKVLLKDRLGVYADYWKG